MKTAKSTIETPPALLEAGDDSDPDSLSSMPGRRFSLPRGFTPYAWMLSGALLFAIMGILTHRAGEMTDWRVVVTARAILSFLFATTLLHWTGGKLLVVGTPTLWMRSISGSISLLATFYALTHLHASEALTITNMFPLWVAFLSLPMLGYAPPWTAWAASIVAIGGVWLIGQQHGADSSASFPWAIGSAVLASFTSAIAMIGLHRLKRVDAAAIVAHFSGVGILFTIGCLLWPMGESIRFDGLTPALVAVLLGVGLSATSGQLCITRAFAIGPPGPVSVVALMQVVFSLAFEVMLGQRTVSATTILGIALVMTPTAWAMIHPRSKG